MRLTYLCRSAGTAVTECHRLRGLNNRNTFLPHPGGFKSKTKVSVALVSSQVLCVVCCGCLLCVLLWPPVASISSSDKDTGPIVSGPLLETSL